MSAWQPIDTAPRDGTELLLWGPCRRFPDEGCYRADANVGWWSAGSWITRTPREVCLATHWQPLPAPPEGA